MLAVRIGTAGALLAAFLAAYFLASPRVWVALCALSLLPVSLEWARLSGVKGSAALGYAVLLAVLLLVLRTVSVVLPWNRLLFAVAVLFWVFAAPLWLRRKPQAGAALLLPVGALVLLAAFAAMAALREAGAGLLLWIMAIVWVSDTAAYFCGVRYGRHKLAPLVSPGKTWEGVWGALVAVLAYAVALEFLVPRIFPGIYGGPAQFLVAAVALAALGILGDLFESQLKRRAGVKDSGRVLPGHGGVLDRIDALLPVLPAAAWWFAR